MKNIIKWIFIGLFSVSAILFLIGFLFLNLSPQFGGKPTEAEKTEYAQTGHYEEGVFTNAEVIQMEMDCHSITQMLKETLQPNPNISPKQDIGVQKISSESLVNKPDTLVRVTWFGHSTFLIEIDGKNILLDPIFSQYAAPHPLLGRKRYHSEMPIEIEELPQIDALIISHDHYDHLDYPSIAKLKEKTDRFFVPLGVDNHLESWGISDENIQKMDWFEEASYANLKIIFTPSRHMSGRGLSDQSTTLWGSWIIQGKTKKIFFSGDGGYGEHFKEIGEKYGPFDLGLMECGQYNKLWADVHMMPEQTVTAAEDVGANLMIPIHWGAFTLATHSWKDPIERVTQEAINIGMPIATPKIGEPVIVGDSIFPQAAWWETIE